MNCEGARNLLYLYREGELSNRQAEELLHHLHSCESCRLEKERIEGVERIAGRLRSFTPILHHADGLTSAIMARIRDAHNEPERLSVFQNILDFIALPPVRIACATFILLAVGTFFFQFFTLFADIHNVELSATQKSQSAPTTGRTYSVEGQSVQGVTGSKEFQSLVSMGEIKYQNGAVIVHQSDITSFLSSNSLQSLSSTIASSFLHIDKKNLDNIMAEVAKNARTITGFEH